MPGFLRTRNGVLLSLLVVSSLIFALPSSVTERALSLFSRSGKRALGDLFASKKEKGGAWGGALFGGVSASGPQGSSVAMVTGNPGDIKSVNFNDKIKGGTTVKGILTPGESRRRRAGIAIGLEEMSGERESLALAGKTADLGGGSAAYAGKSLFAGEAAPESGDRLKTALQDAEVPGERGVKVAAGTGRIPKSLAKAYNEKGVAHMEENKVEGANEALTVLAEGKINSGAVKKTDGHENAAVTVAALFDGNRIGKPGALDNATAPRVDGASIPRIPNGLDFKLKEEEKASAKEPVSSGRKKRSVVVRRAGGH